MAVAPYGQKTVGCQQNLRLVLSHSLAWAESSYHRRGLSASRRRIQSWSRGSCCWCWSPSRASPPRSLLIILSGRSRTTNASGCQIIAGGATLLLGAEELHLLLMENCEHARRYKICPEIAPCPCGAGPGASRRARPELRAPFAHNMLIWRNRSTSRLRCCLWRSTTVVGWMLLRLVGAGRLRRTAPRVSLPPASWDQRATGGRGRNISAACKGTGQNKRLKVEVNLYSESPFSSFPLAWGTPLLCCDNLSNLFSTVKADKLGDSFTSQCLEKFHLAIS